MRKVTTTLLSVCLVISIFPATGAHAAHPAQGNFGLSEFDVEFAPSPGEPPMRAGSHPAAMTISLGANLDGAGIPEGWLRDIVVKQIQGLVGDTTAYPRCSNTDFLDIEEGLSACAVDTQVGINAVEANEPDIWTLSPIYNLAPPPGVLVRLGFTAALANVVVDVGLTTDPPYRAVGASRNTSQLAKVLANKLQLWGDPSDPEHDELRGKCGVGAVSVEPGEDFDFEGFGESCPIPPRSRPFLTLPTDCSAPLATDYEVLSWEGESESGSILTHDESGAPAPFNDCASLKFEPSISAQPTSRAAQSPTGLDVSLDVADEGLISVGGRAQSSIREVVFTLPQGMTANPSVAEGLEVCSEQDLREETLQAVPGEGCPQASKIGSLEVESPLIGEPLKGALYQATPHANLADDSLIAFYLVFKNPGLGVIVKQAVKVEPDPRTGQLKATSSDIPQLPFSSFRLHFREGGRSPLVTPSQCGTYTAEAVLTPWSGTAPVTATSSFQIASGPGGGPCPPGGTPPFEPGFEAGSENNAAGAFSPFVMRLTRRDGDQDLTRFDATLPRGVVAKLAGVDKCPDAQIAVAKAKTGKAELDSPSCPLNSRIGTVQAGAGVGSQLTYVPGSIYLAGPFGGAPLSAVAVVPAVAGPFDVGTVVYRQAIRVNPRTGEVSADGGSSDPLPHILAGIPVPVRDVQVHIERSGFTLNPTSCNPFETKAALWGAGADPFSSSDDSHVARRSPFQAASCASLGFKPKLSLRLKGGVKRGSHPEFRALYKPRPGDANLEGLVLRFPRSAFLDQAHIRTICTRVQYAAKSCPSGSVYGQVRAFTPLLSEPLEGPVYLRSSDHDLPDVVFSLHGIVDFEAVIRVDSKKGGIRTTLTEAPDAPIDKVVVSMQGGRKGLIVNSTDLCTAKHRANVTLDAQNGKRLKGRPLVQATCGKQKSKRR
jgi:hypothetical protein